MIVLYCAIDQDVPGTTGGSVHVAAVASGLAALGHDVHVLATPGHGGFPVGSVRYHPLGPPLGCRELRWMRWKRVLTFAEALRPDVVIERYYNFGGEGLRAARRTGAIAVLEVNAPVIDHPGSAKLLLDRALLVHPMRRWREWQCRATDLILTPSRAIVPSWLPADRVLQIEWGADTDRFVPGAPGPRAFERKPGQVIALFAGAFRRWHGAIHLVDAVGRLRAEGRRDIVAILIGDGPELARVRERAGTDDGIVFTGARPHAEMPGSVAAADIGVAPFDVGAHPPLALDFYWSPLKIFEYMAAGLPVVAPDLPRLRQLVTHEREGLLYDAHDPAGLARALARLADEAAVRRRLGESARSRAVREYSWSAHCRRLEAAIRAVRAQGPRAEACAS